MTPKPPSREQLTIARDLSRFLRERIVQHTDDYMERCAEAGVPETLAISQLTAALLDVTCFVLTQTTTTTPFQFGEMCTESYRIHYNRPNAAKEKSNV